MRIDVRRVEQLKAAGNEFIGSRTRAKIVKNKLAPPFREAEFDIMYGSGISKEGEIVDIAVKLDIIHKSGAWFSYGEQRLGQGRDKVKQYLRDNPDFMAQIEQQIRSSDRFAELMGSGSDKKDSENVSEDVPETDDDGVLIPNNGRMPKIKIDIAAD